MNLGIDSMNSTISTGFDVLVGRDSEQLVTFQDGRLLHPLVLNALMDLQKAAQKQGFNLAVASSYRSYSRQLLIWQEKVAGLRPVLNANEDVLDVTTLDEEELLRSILYWSALPGTSRHHWGTDIDVFDANAFQGDAKLQLTVSECCDGGPLTDFHCWLDGVLDSEQNHGFFRPYTTGIGGVAQEPWHLSYAPVADRLSNQFTYAVFERLLAEKKWPLYDVIQLHAEEIFQRYIQLH